MASRKHPKQLIVSCILGKHAGIGLFYSADGGETWKFREFREGDADPVVAFGPDGAGYLAYQQAFAGRTVQAFFQRSDDGGKTWGPLVPISEKAQGDIDHSMIAVDHTGGKLAGRIYVGMYASKAGILVHRSHDGGRTFQTAAAVPDWSNTHSYVHNMVVLSDGTLFIPLAQVDDTRGRFYRAAVFYSIVSTDGGQTFSKPRKIAGPVVNSRPALHGVTNVVCATGRHKEKDRIYALWNERREGGARMQLTLSDDRGATWSKPKDIITDTPPDEEHGACNVAVSGDGTVGVSWLNHEPGGKYDAWFTASVDGGMTFSPPLKLSRKTSHIPAGQERPFPGADYMLMDAGPDSTFHVIWPDSRDGKAYQLYTCTVRVGLRSVRTPNRRLASRTGWKQCLSRAFRDIVARD